MDDEPEGDDEDDEMVEVPVLTQEILKKWQKAILEVCAFFRNPVLIRTELLYAVLASITQSAPENAVSIQVCSPYE